MRSSEKKYPYQDLNLKDLRGERWKPIPDFEGLYAVSNHGRVKSLGRIIMGRWKEIYKPERILRLKANETDNKTLGVPIYSLVATLTIDGVKHYFAVSRLVYHCFVAPIGVKGRSQLVSFKDKDGRNTHYSNLFITTNSEILFESFRSNRHKSHLSILSKPVTQYDSDGQPIAWYPSYYDAGKQTGFSNRSIAAVAGQQYICYKGYFWRTGTHKRKLKLDSIETGYPERPAVNKELAKKLGIKIAKGTDVPAFLNLSLTNMKGERWKPFPGHAGLYEISNMGRVKSLRRISEGKQKKWVLEKIKMLGFDFRLGPDGRNVAGSALVTLDKGSDKKIYSVARYVYYCFIAPFNLDDTNGRIYYKDDNTTNLHYKNLLLKRGVWSIHKTLDRSK